MAKAKTQTFKGRNVRGAAKSDDAAVAQRQEDAERTMREAEEGTGTKVEKGYSGSSDYTDNAGNKNLDPGQATPDQIKNAEAGKPLTEEDPAE